MLSMTAAWPWGILRPLVLSGGYEDKFAVQRSVRGFSPDNLAATRFTYGSTSRNPSAPYETDPPGRALLRVAEQAALLRSTRRARLKARGIGRML